MTSLRKICRNCNVEKCKTEFRIRRKGKYSYLNNNCKKCDAELRMIYYHKIKADSNYREKERARVKKYRIENRGKCLVNEKIRRQKDSYKTLMRDYRVKNKSKIFEMGKITKRKYHEKNRDAISNIYVISKLRNKGIEHPTVQQIEFKRLQILISRLKRKIKMYV